ncbi:ubiquitin C [Gigaspora margarita]|uniref:Ubiquitin C n=1 Tax=Gigaspora margarita TaxID=4874 RepID=A0A8H4AUA7_GIGMA|nr:ubiquitin C [Gigaspora margarita]
MYDGKFPLNVESSDTIDNVKSKIFSILGIQDDLSLILAGQLLKDKQTLSDYNIQNRFIIYSCIALSRIFIKVPAGKTFHLGARPFDTIGCIKLEIQTLKKCQFKIKTQDQQRLIFTGVQLNDSRALSDYDIPNNATLYLLLRLRGRGNFNLNLFQDLTKSVIVKPWKKDAPSWRIAVVGLNLEDGEPPQKVDSEWIIATNDGYTTFESEELVSWMNLVVKVKR